MDGHQQHLRRGFNWLGGATIVAKLTDVATILLVLRFLTKEQGGAGSLVVAFGAGESLTYLTARQIHLTPTSRNGQSLYIVGCRYTGRTEYRG